MFDKAKGKLGSVGWRGGGVAALVLASIAATVLHAAPAPPYRGLPQEVEEMLGIYNRWLITADGHERSALRARTVEQRECYLRGVEMFRRDSYCLPVPFLERALRDSRYQGREEQEAMRRALEKYRQRRDDARMSGLFKPNPPAPAAKGR